METQIGLEILLKPDVGREVCGWAIQSTFGSDEYQSEKKGEKSNNKPQHFDEFLALDIALP